MNQVTDINQNLPAKRDRIEVVDAVPLLDTSRFEHMQRVATVMARSTLMPDTLWMEGKKDDKQPLPYEQILSNCFLVVNQAVRWGLDPFAVAQCVSVVHGKLCYEGKLVSAVLQAKMGMSLHHVIVGEGEATRIYLSDKPITDDIKPLLKPAYRRDDMRLFDGSVAEWKTTGANSPWSPKNFTRMLIYRGTRDWCRIYEPALMLGVYTDDEMGDMEDNVRFRGARNVTPINVIPDPLSDEPISLPRSAPDETVEFDQADSPDEAHDPETGELSPDEHSSEAGSPDASDVDDAPAPPASDRTSSEPEGDSSPSSGSSIPEKEIVLLRRFAKDVFLLASKTETSGDMMTKVINRWINIELLNVRSEAGRDAVKAIHQSVKAIMKDEVSYEAAVEFHAEGLGVSTEELMGGVGNG